MLGFLKQDFRMKGMANNICSLKLNSDDLRLHLFMFFSVLGSTFYDVWCLGDRLEISWFSRAARSDPRVEGSYLGVAASPFLLKN